MPPAFTTTPASSRTQTRHAHSLTHGHTTNAVRRRERRSRRKRVASVGLASVALSATVMASLIGTAPAVGGRSRPPADRRRHGTQRPRGVGCRHPRRPGLLAGRRRRRRLRLRGRRLPRFRGRPAPRRAPSWGSPRPPTAEATGRWPPTAASSPSVTPRTTARPAATRSAAPSWAWPAPVTETVTGWSAPTGASSPSVTPPTRAAPPACRRAAPSWASRRRRTTGATGRWPPTATSTPSATPATRATPRRSPRRWASTSPVGRLPDRRRRRRRLRPRRRQLRGSLAGLQLNKPIVATSAAQGGSIDVAGDGGVFTFGSVGFYGSLGCGHGVQPPPPPPPPLRPQLRPAPARWCPTTASRRPRSPHGTRSTCARRAATGYVNGAVYAGGLGIEPGQLGPVQHVRVPRRRRLRHPAPADRGGRGLRHLLLRQPRTAAPDQGGCTGGY